MRDGDKPILNPVVLLREEFDDWAILFDPDTGKGFGLNPTGVYLWKLLDGEHSTDEMLSFLRRESEGVPEDAIAHVLTFIGALVAEGLAGSKRSGDSPEQSSCFSPPLDRARRFSYEVPKLVYFGGGQSALGDCVSHGSVGGDCNASGAGATGCCLTVGTCALTVITSCCGAGVCADAQCCGSGGTFTGACTNGTNAGSSCVTGKHF